MKTPIFSRSDQKHQAGFGTVRSYLNISGLKYTNQFSHMIFVNRILYYFNWGHVATSASSANSALIVSCITCLLFIYICMYEDFRWKSL